MFDGQPILAVLVCEMHFSFCNLQCWMYSYEDGITDQPSEDRKTTGGNLTVFIVFGSFWYVRCISASAIFSAGRILIV